MNKLIDLAVRQPITIAVAVILVILAGLVTWASISIRMTPEVESIVISVSTNWENATPEQMESDVIEQQERRLGELRNLQYMTSISRAGAGQIRLEFRTGTDIRAAMAEVVQRLDEVPVYPDGVSQPVVRAIDPDSIDFIAWIGLSTSDPAFDATTLYDFMERRLKPRFERIPGVAEVGLVGGREREVQIRIDPTALAQRGITLAELVDTIRLSNDNFSGGLLPEGKSDIQFRAIGRFYDPERVRNLVIRRDASGPVYLHEVAEIAESNKEMVEWVRARGHQMPFFNFQLESGANLLDTMEEIKAEVAELNAPDGILEQEARRLGIHGNLELVQTFDATEYVEDAIAMVQGNLLIGAILAVATLLLFLRSLRTIGIIALAVPISIVGSVVVLIAMGRSINIVSLAGMAFAVGMVLDNSIVVIENIFRHLEMGKAVRRAVVDATKEVSGAVLASTLTTVIVFLPVVLIQEQAGQLFRDIALAIVSAVVLSLLVAFSVIPAAASRFLIVKKLRLHHADDAPPPHCQWFSGRMSWANQVVDFGRNLKNLPAQISEFVGYLIARPKLRLGVIAGFALATIIGISILIPPMDYLPRGNRNVAFSVLIPPPAYNVDQLFALGERIESTMRPAWEVFGDRFEIEQVMRGGAESERPDNRVALPIEPGSDEKVIPPMLRHYFLVARNNRLFQGAIVDEKDRVVDILPLLNASTTGANAPDVLSFSFQVPLFRLGGTTGAAIKIDLVGDDLDQVTDAGRQMFLDLMAEFGPGTVTPEPANFMLPAPELRVIPDDERLRDLGMTRRDIGLAVQAHGDGIVLVRQFESAGELKDLKIISQDALGSDPIQAAMLAPIAAPTGQIIDLASVAEIRRERVTNQIKRVDRQRAVTLQFTAPASVALEDAIDRINTKVAELREEGRIPPGVDVRLSGSAGRLAEIRQALVGDGSFAGMLTSSLFLALAVVYLLMVVLFQSWKYPFVIMISVPFAALGGFIGLALVHHWSEINRYLPVQNMDVLTIFGFVILAGTVVNNSILIVHQALNFLKGDTGDTDMKLDDIAMTPTLAIQLSVKSRVRPILMSTCTSVLGMLPLIILPGAGSELYRGLGAVIVGGMLLSTVFTLFFVPVVLSLFLKEEQKEESEVELEETTVA